MSKQLVIGVTGISRCGKNTFCDLLKAFLNAKGIKTETFSFAQQLRNETSDFLDENFGFNVWDSKDKEKFRPFLVWYANLKRQESKGQYFIDKLKHTLSLYKKEQVMLISDLRFKEFDYDELDFCKENGGVVVHISKYNIETANIQNDGPYIKAFDKPPNEFEAKNDPILKAASDYQIIWEDQGGKTENLLSHVTKFVDWLVEKKYI